MSSVDVPVAIMLGVLVGFVIAVVVLFSFMGGGK